MRWLKVTSLFFVLTASAQGTNWLSFEGKGKSPPQVEFKGGEVVEFAISGMEVKEKREGKNRYQLLWLPGEGLLRDPGKPQLPRITRILAIPPGEVPKVEVVSEESSLLEGYNIYPAPRPVIKRSPDGTRWVDYEFTKDETLYSQDDYFPSQIARIERTGWLRGQRIAWLSINPIQFNPQKRTIRVYTSLRLKVKGASSLSPVNLGPLEKLGDGLLFNYPQRIEDMPTSRRVGVSRPQDLRSPENQADYLIISPDTVYGSQWLDSLAEWRVENNGFQVAIVKLSDVYAQFPSFEQDQSIKDFLTFVYENWFAPSMGDGHLGYLLLVGDAAEGDPLYLPTHYIWGKYNWEIATDHWYACLNDDNGDGVVDDRDDTPDILIGRFSVGSEADLQAEVEKTLSFERSSWDTAEWKRKILLYSGFVLNQVDGYLEDDFGYIKDLASKQGQFFISDTLYRSDYSNPAVWEVKNKFLAGLNQGRGIVNVYTHGAPDLWGDGQGWHMFYNYEVTNLQNSPYYPVVLSYSCETAWFDSIGIDCLGEVFVRAKDKGAVAFYGSSRLATAIGCINQNKGMLQALLGYKIYNLGQIILWGKLQDQWDIYNFNLLGDPALSFDNHPRLGRPDLAISPEDVSVFWFPWSYNSRTAVAQVHNLGRGRAENVKVTFWDGPPGGDKIGEGRIEDIDPLGEAEVSILWAGNLSGRHQLFVQIDPQNSIPEISEDNNLASIPVEVPQFVDITDQIGIGSNSSRGGIWGDYDGDGDPDLLLLVGSSVRLLENEGFHFTDVTSSSGIIPPYELKGATWGDYDNDGDLDLYLVSDGRNYLYQNQGSGQFLDVTQGAGVDDNGKGFGAAFLDLDNDGYLDILLENYALGIRQLIYFHNNGDGSFTHKTPSGLGDTGKGCGIAVGDYDNDGDIDLYFPNHGKNLLLRNKGDGNFEDVTSTAGVGYNAGVSLAAGFDDYDHDGDLDLYVGNYREDILYQNNGDGTFSRMDSGNQGFEESAEVLFLDYDNDGCLELLVVDPYNLALYRIGERGSFEEVPYFAGGLSLSGIGGMSPVDYNLDGWVDLLVYGGSYYQSRSYLLHNLAGESHWLKVKLKGLRSNMNGVGARVKVATGDLIQSRMIYPSTTLFPSQPPVFGLGDREIVDSLVVRWPSGRRSFLTGIGVDQTVEVQEPLCGKDLSLQSIISPHFRLNIGDTIHPQVIVRNIGKSEATGYVVSCQIDTGGVAIYSKSTPGSPIPSLDTARITLPSWVPSSFGSYNFNFNVDFPSDEDTSNNQKARKVSISPFSNIITTLPDSGKGPNRYVCFGDYNRNGYPDILLVTSNSLKLYENQGGRRFNDVSKELALPSGDFCSAIFLDYNNDGYLDILALQNSGHPCLLRNEEGKGFVDVSESVGLSGLDSYHALAIGDYDQDGWLDIFLSNASWSYDQSRSVLLRNIGGKFSDYTFPAGLSTISTLGFYAAAFFDYDTDGDLDLFLTGHYSVSFLYENNGDGTFTDVAGSVGLRYTYGEDVTIGDYDNDGDLDVYLVKGNHEPNQLYQNDGSGNFSEVASSAGVDYLGMGGKAFWADYDDDGDLDLFLINKSGLNVLYQNQGNGTFQDRAWEAGIDYPGSGEAFAFSDIDQNGYMDFYIAVEDGEGAFFRNDLSGNHWLEVKLSGILSNSLGVGGKVELFSGEGRQVRWLTAVKGDYSLHFGLGNEGIVDSLRVTWPSRKRQVLPEVSVDQVLEITEPLLAHDLRVEAILSPSREFNLREPFVPRIKIKNIGQNREEGFQVSYTLVEEEKELFSEEKGISSLESMDTTTVSFSPWTPKDFAKYTLSFEVILPSDLDQSDNLATLGTALPIFSPLPFSGLSGLGARSVTLGDYNRDGRPDLYLSSGSLLRNEGDGTFPGVTQIAGVGENGSTVLLDVLFFDYDNDGDEDLLGLDHRPPYVLYENKGDDTFAKIQVEGIISGSNSLTVADYDNDGYLDLFVLTFDNQGILLRNLGDGRFEDRTEEPGLGGLSRSYAALFFDYDLDGDEDLFILNGSSWPNQLYLNNGDGTFEDVAEEAGVQRGDGVITVGDYDNNGFPDIFIAGSNILYHNEGNGEFGEVRSDSLGLNGIQGVSSSSFGDYDNDGWLDLYLVRRYEGPSVLFHNQGDGTFSPLNDLSGLGKRNDEIGSVFFDYDGDGDQDLYLTSYGGDESCLYQNNLKGNNWLNLKLVGKESNQDGIGTLVRVVAGGLVQVKESSFGFRFHTLPWLHFGLGKRLKADTILVRWPSGVADTLVDIKANQTLIIEEGKATERYGLPKTFTLFQNYPNPFNSVTVIRYGIPYGEVAKVKLTIYDILGRKVKKFFAGEKKGGFHQFRWDGRNNGGEKVGSGIYFYRLEAKWQGLKTVKTKKMVLLK